MKVRKQILRLLLSAFIFVTVHDFVIGYVDADTQVDLYMHQAQQAPLCSASVIHELIHMSLISIESSCDISSYLISEKTWVQTRKDNVFSSLFQHRLDRPPIA